MIKKLDKYIFLRLLGITLFVVGVLIFIFVVIHFSDHSEDFTDNGATFTQIFTIYYPNYIPEMIRLVTPVAVFVACLYLTGQMAERLEIVALKAAGVSLYRLLAPYLVFGFLMMVGVSYLDGFVVPETNAKRFAFEEEYLAGSTQKIDDQNIYRQESENTILKINYYNPAQSSGYRVEFFTFADDTLREAIDARQMKWNAKKEMWTLINVSRKRYTNEGFQLFETDSSDTTLSILPRDLARTTSDIYQLTYPEAQEYIQSIERSGAGSVEEPKVKLYGRLGYPFSIIIVSIIGFALASVRRRGGKGFYIAAGLAISFLYLAMIKVIEPFGGQGVLTPALAVAIPHLFFLIIGISLLIGARK